MLEQMTSMETQGRISEIQVCRNGNGMFYIGRMLYDNNGWEEPYDRLSQEYYKNREDADEALENRTFTPRYYEMGEETRDMVFLFMSNKSNIQ